MLILGLGIIAGNYLSGELKALYWPKGGEANFKAIFMYPMLAALGAATALFCLFHPPRKSDVPA